MKNNFLNRIQNLILRKTSYISLIPEKEKVVYLTFDDGPEDGITEFVLDELDKYGYRATFFCRGDNAYKHPELLRQLRDKGHSIGNHTYNHFHSFETDSEMYALDVENANAILQTNLFRPPHGCLTFSTWLKIHKHNSVFFWTLNSGDSSLGKYDYDECLLRLKKYTTPGAIILFHFCHKHEKETKELLPVYLKWLYNNEFRADAIVL